MSSYHMSYEIVYQNNTKDIYQDRACTAIFNAVPYSIQKDRESVLAIIANAHADKHGPWAKKLIYTHEYVSVSRNKYFPFVYEEKMQEVCDFINGFLPNAVTEVRPEFFTTKLGELTNPISFDLNAAPRPFLFIVFSLIRSLFEAGPSWESNYFGISEVKTTAIGHYSPIPFFQRDKFHQHLEIFQTFVKNSLDMEEWYGWNRLDTGKEVLYIGSADVVDRSELHFNKYLEKTLTPNTRKKSS